MLTEEQLGIPLILLVDGTEMSLLEYRTRLEKSDQVTLPVEQEVYRREMDRLSTEYPNAFGIISEGDERMLYLRRPVIWETNRVPRTCRFIIDKNGPALIEDTTTYQDVPGGILSEGSDRIDWEGVKEVWDRCGAKNDHVTSRVTVDGRVRPETILFFSVDWHPGSEAREKLEKKFGEVQEKLASEPSGPQK